MAAGCDTRAPDPIAHGCLSGLCLYLYTGKKTVTFFSPVYFGCWKRAAVKWPWRGAAGCVRRGSVGPPSVGRSQLEQRCFSGGLGVVFCRLFTPFPCWGGSSVGGVAAGGSRGRRVPRGRGGGSRVGSPGPAWEQPPRAAPAAASFQLSVSARFPALCLHTLLVPASRNERAEKCLKFLSPALFQWPSPCWDHPGETSIPAVPWAAGRGLDQHAKALHPSCFQRLCSPSVPFCPLPMTQLHSGGVGTFGGQGSAGS